MENNYSNILLLLIFAGLPLAIIVFLHEKTFAKNIKIILKVNIFSFFFWILGGNVAYQQKIWLVTYNDLLNQQILGILLGDIIQSIIGTTLISFAVILMYETYRKGQRIRDIIFKKE